jgi:hypothetical protein
MPEVDDDTTEQTTDEPIIDIPETNTNTQNRIGRLFDRLADMFAGNDKGDDQII